MHRRICFLAAIGVALTIVGCADNTDLPPLHRAARENDIAAVKKCLDRGYDVNARVRSGYRALHLAVMNPSKEIVGLLIARGADVNARTDDGTVIVFMGATPADNLQQNLDIFEQMHRSFQFK